MKEHVKLHFLLGHGFFLSGSWLLRAGGKLDSHADPMEITPECRFTGSANWDFAARMLSNPEGRPPG